MKRVLRIGFPVLALTVLPVLMVSADPAAEPVQTVSLDDIFAPAEVAAPVEASPMEGALFAAEEDVLTTVCCQGNLAVCHAGCASRNRDVCYFSCRPDSTGGCSSSCSCC